MENIKTYEEFINEGIKDKLIGGAIALSTMLPNKANANVLDFDNFNKDKDSITINKVTKSDNKAKSLIKYDNFKLDSTIIDTIWNDVVTKKPQTIIRELKLQFSSDTYFNSGEFILNELIKNEIKDSINNIILADGIITNIKLESSTDKQKLGNRLSKELLSKGFEPNNKGLSNARCESLTSYIKTIIDIDDSLIKKEIKFETGINEIDLNNRYVTINIYYIDSLIDIKPAISENTYKIINTYYLSKKTKINKPKVNNLKLLKFKKTNKKTDIRKTKRHNNMLDCSDFDN